MILIADGGSTKCDWIALDSKGELLFKTQTLGLNPTVLSTQKIHQRVANNEKLAHFRDEVSKLYFYGAGCGTHKSRSKIKRFFRNYFTKANCEVKGDLFAACHAVTDKPGIVCILGTGSNSCYFDGVENIRPNAPALGYILMDEASGNYFGKELLKDYFYHQMPEDLSQKFELEFDLDPVTIRENLYQKENPNAYLANFTPFIFREIPLPAYQEELLTKGLRLFMENRILPYSQSREVPIHFVGSIAYFSRHIISNLLTEFQLEKGKIIQWPIDGLLEKIKGELSK